MSSDKPSFEELNAYVDKELPAGRAADVARYIAEDAAIARTVAVLTRLRSTIPEAVDVPPLELPNLKPERAKRRAWLVAASIAILLLISSTAFISMRELSSNLHWIEAAMSTHNSWRLPDNSADPSSTPLLREVINRDKSLTDAYIPDLSASKLSIVLVDMSPSFIKDPAILVGYAGTRGCKVTLVATSKELEGSGEFRFLAQGENSAYAWRSGNLEYLLIAKGMDSERFDLIAESVYRATIERLPFDDSTRTALLDSRRKSVPCMA